MDYCYSLIPAITLLFTAATVSSVCLDCGTIQKSGKMSCCGRGGSWFGKCGSAENANLSHTWYEGIRACKARQFQAVPGEHLGVSQPESKISSYHTNVVKNSKAVIGTALLFAFTPGSTSTQLSRPAPVTTSAKETTMKPVRVSLVYNADSRSPKTIARATTAVNYAAVHTSLSEPTIPLVRMAFSAQASSIITKLTHSASNYMLITASSDTSDSSSIMEKEYEDLSHFDTGIRHVTYLSLLLLLACFCF